MSEDMEVTLARLEALATPVGEPKPLFGYEVVATLLEHIRELQKRLGELEARVREELQINHALAQSIDAERQRREELEHIATLTCDLDKPFGRAAVEQARVRYFSRHPSSSGNEPPSGSDNREKVADAD